MCLINFHYNEHPTYQLIVAANRDEFFERPTAEADFWMDNPAILAGRDLRHLGTWLGITKSGRFAALTNYRDPAELGVNKRSRGELVRNFLTGKDSPVDYLETVKVSKDEYAGFNLIVGRFGELFYFSNKQADVMEIPSGTHGLSNHLLNTKWPKVTKGTARLRAYVQENDHIKVDVLFDILADTEAAPEEQLPSTGVELELERQLSPLFIDMPEYGTRCSTVLLVGHDRRITFVERTFLKGKLKDEKEFVFFMK